MKPTRLKPGDRVQFRDSRRVLRFVRRVDNVADCWREDVSIS